MGADGGWRTWRRAMAEALYGPGGFYLRPEGGPGHHFRTSSSAATEFAGAVVTLLRRVDAALEHPPTITFVEIAAARGALLTAVDHLVREGAPELAARLTSIGVELAPRPASLPAHIAWVRSVADAAPVTGLLFANEWLDNVPLDVVERTADGVHLVEVAPDGVERPGGTPDAADRAWLDEWWPRIDGEDDRAEIGRTRDEAWAEAVAALGRGVAVCVDYGHVREHRMEGAFPAGTLTGYRSGHVVHAVPDGSCDLTAHVALDSVAATGARHADSTSVTDQRTALQRLGVSADRPPIELAHSEPRRYFDLLAATGRRAELIARGGLGDFGWVMHGRDVDVTRLLD